LDLKLLAWGLRQRPGPLPRLWLFTDDRRLPDPRAAVASLPPGKAGVVLRHDHDPAREALGQDLARICRARRLALVVAGDGRLAAALKAGVHLRGGYRPEPFHPAGAVTSSAHSVRDLKRAQRAGAQLIFLSPAFPTASHAGSPGLGPLRWAAIARRGSSGDRVAALGGVDGRSVKRLPRHLCQAVGAIGALAATPRQSTTPDYTGCEPPGLPLQRADGTSPALPRKWSKGFDGVGARNPGAHCVP
jgi:thiamine-phosphate pyrophosphorylase